MKIYAAKVEDGIVTQVQVIREGQTPDDLIIIGTENVVGIGYSYEDGKFIEPIPQEE